MWYIKKVNPIKATSLGISFLMKKYFSHPISTLHSNLKWTMPPTIDIEFAIGSMQMQDLKYPYLSTFDIISSTPS
jgi:hypothetical protein